MLKIFSIIAPLALLTAQLEASNSPSYTEEPSQHLNTSPKRPAMEDADKTSDTPKKTKADKAPEEIPTCHKLLNDLADEAIQEEGHAYNKYRNIAKPYNLIKLETGTNLDSLVTKFANGVALQLLTTNPNKSSLIRKFNNLQNLGWSIYELCEHKTQRTSLINLFVLMEYGLYLRNCPEAINRKNLMVFCYYVHKRIAETPEGSNILEPPHKFYISSAKKILEICDGFADELRKDELRAAQTLRQSLLHIQQLAK